ncbi:SDR family oxidoreductase [Altererythrobacter sp. BO-6]|uniref:SDR family oxidoreductase n=1 Tax=Altererythrobacter sp. BO-6 TaxID=2604537 RepID=UPI0013E11B7C|nr:SDR family oxidoreductase [Altererythrobacter sp. BO-6]QIG54717.1 SDR family oxidoreductase [Altererythrobacter sp. BO-6]
MMYQKVSLVTNATGYAGPGATMGLHEDKWIVAAADPSFVDPNEAASFVAGRADLHTFYETDPLALVAAVLKRFGRIDALISNDIVPDPIRPIDGSSASELREVLEQGVVYPFELSQAVLPHMRERGSGAIIFVTSTTARFPMAQVGIYGAARAAATGYAISLGQAVGPENIQVNVVGPNWMKNPTYFPDGWEELMPGFKPKLDNEVPLRRLGRPDELGALIALLASQKAMPLTAQYINFAAGAYP